MNWIIRREEEDSEGLDDALNKGYEPFAVTREDRVETGYDNYTNRVFTDRSTVNVIWLRYR